MNKEKGIAGLMISRVQKGWEGKQGGTFNWGKTGGKKEASPHSVAQADAVVKSCKHADKDMIAKLHLAAIKPLTRKGPKKNG